MLRNESKLIDANLREHIRHTNEHKQTKVCEMLKFIIFYYSEESVKYFELTFLFVFFQIIYNNMK